MQLEHYIVCGKIRIVVRTTQEVLPGVELTLPFDPDYRSCRYPLSCACARSRCPVQKWCRKLARNKVMPNLDYGKFITSRLREYVSLGNIIFLVITWIMYFTIVIVPRSSQLFIINCL